MFCIDLNDSTKPERDGHFLVFLLPMKGRWSYSHDFGEVTLLIWSIRVDNNLCVHILGCRHNHLHTKNKIELWENNNNNRIFVGHLHISLILQGSRMAETSNLLGCEMCLMDMWNVPFSVSFFYLVAIPEESEQHTAQQMSVIKYFGCQLTSTRREEENEMDTVSFYPCPGEN